jgi:hypothetical protein
MQETRDHSSFFQAENNLGEFNWQSTLYGNLRRKGTQITLNDKGIMRIRSLAAQSEVRSYQPGPAAIPDIFLEQFILEMHDENISRAVLDVIDSDGKISPMLAQITESTDNSAIEGGFAFEARLDYLDEPGTSELVYFDSNKHIIKAVLQQTNKYILESTTVEKLLEEFPDYGRIIQQLSRPQIQDTTDVLT